MKNKTLISVFLLLLTAVCLLGAVACKKNSDDSKNEHVHTYSLVTISPTCTEKGYTTYTCKCGHSYVDDYVDALGHDLIHHNGKEATVEEVGYKAYDTCTRCDYTLTKRLYTLESLLKLSKLTITAVILLFLTRRNLLNFQMRSL